MGARRAPIKTAREHATKALVKAHADEHKALTDAYLADLGFTQEEVTTKKWVYTEPAKP